MMIIKEKKREKIKKVQLKVVVYNRKFGNGKNI